MNGVENGTKTVGETHVVQGNFTDDDGVPYNPDSTYMRVLSPLGALTTAGATNQAVGEYHYPYIGTSPGVWRFWVHGDGPGTNIVIEKGYACFEEGQ